MNELMTRVFENEEFGSVRTIMLEGEPWFVSADVCRALQIKNPRDAVERLDSDEKNTVVLNDGIPGNPNVTVVNEPGLYTLVLGSRKPEARRFKRWITHEVIPSIRKHGAYMTTDTVEHMLQDPAWSIRLLQEIQSEREKSAQLALKIEADRPKVEFADAVEVAANSIPIGEKAKRIGQTGVKASPSPFFRQPCNDRYLMQRGGDDVPTQRALEAGLMEVNESEEFGKGRTVVKNGAALFCGTDAVRPLGYSIPSKAVNTHCKGVSKMDTPTNGGVQKLMYIPEGDVYRFIVRSPSIVS